MNNAKQVRGFGPGGYTRGRSLVQALGDTKFRVISGAFKKYAMVQLIAGQFVVFQDSVSFKTLKELNEFINNARIMGVEVIG